MAAGQFFSSPNYPQYVESTEIQFAEFLRLLCPSLQLRDIACSTSRHSKWELMQRSPRLALTSRPLPSSVNLLLFFQFALCNTALGMEMRTVTMVKSFLAFQLLVYPNNDSFKVVF